MYGVNTLLKFQANRRRISVNNIIIYYGCCAIGRLNWSRGSQRSDLRLALCAILYSGSPSRDHTFIYIYIHVCVCLPGYVRRMFNLFFSRVSPSPFPRRHRSCFITQSFSAMATATSRANRLPNRPATRLRTVAVYWQRVFCRIIRTFLFFFLLLLSIVFMVKFR